MKTQKEGVSKILRKRRRGSKNGDMAGCYIRFNNKEIWRTLGAWDSPEVRVEYEKVQREWRSGQFADRQHEDGVSLAFLFGEFLHEAQKKYHPPDISQFMVVIRIMTDLFPDMLVRDFTATNFRAVRKALTDRGLKRQWSRQYVNRMLTLARRVFYWGVSYDYTPAEVIIKIKSVPGLEVWEAGQLQEKEPVEDVPDWAVIRTLPFMSPVIADMVKLQRGACMRPGEVCNLRVGDIDSSGEVWVLRAKKHKTARHGTKRIVAFGPPEIEILRRRSAGKGPDEYVFSPRSAQQEYWAAKRAARKTKVQPTQVKRGEKVVGIMPTAIPLRTFLLYRHAVAVNGRS